MLVFDPQDPFPLIALSGTSYASQKEHAAQADAWLGLSVSSIETQIFSQSPPSNSSSEQHWIGLDPQSLLTPYTELRALLEHIRYFKSVVDLGAAYGRLGFVMHRHFSSAQFTGYECVSRRVNEGNRVLQAHGCERSALIDADIADPSFEPAAADLYFIYDFGSQSAIDKALKDLARVAEARAIQVVGRGRLSRNLIERQHPWLSQVHAPEHFDHFSIYRS